ncbi:MAG: dihydrofolate reductase [Sphingobacteriales bacterium]|nr:MAG: dihydrofolate reductase [Sphingobacteriales bacterium]
MRKIIVLEHLTIDGVMQAPGGPEEDASGKFELGGWSAPYHDVDEVSTKVMGKLLEPADLMLGRKTFDIFEEYWPKHAEQWPGVNEVTKYVLSTTRSESAWQNVQFLTGVDDIKKLKETEGGDIKIWGSSKLVQLLLQHDLVDEFWLNVYPVVLGKGKKLFDENSIPRTFKVVESHVSPSGVVMLHYKKAGEVKTGTVGE